MADLLARFKVVDEMSDKLSKMAESGQNMTSQLEQAGESANATFENITNSITTATSSVDGVAVSIDNLKDVTQDVVYSTDILMDTMSGYESTIKNVSMQTDYWTQAVGNYDKSLMETIYSTEELVEQGFKSAEALNQQERMFELCDRSANSLNKSMEATVDIQNELSEAVETAIKVSDELFQKDSVSADTKAILSRASNEAANAMRKLISAQEEAKTAMEAYDAVITSGTTNLSELESSAEKAGHAAENLAEANGKASEATQELSKATQIASEEAEKSVKKGLNAIESIASALATAGITAIIKEISDTTYGLATAFSEAENSIVLATGATGNALDKLTMSMMNVYAVSKTGSINETAAAIGEINTRLGYTDDILMETTELFLDFAAVTDGNAASSVRNITQLMNQWNIPAFEMENILDKLTYAGQASGISVYNLSGQLTSNKAILDQLGFSLDEAIAMFMKFELAGTNSATIMTGFRTAISSGAISSLNELYDVFDQISSGIMTATDASQIFGSRASTAIVNAVNSGVLSLDDMVASLETADGILSTTAKAAQTLDQKWSQASNNIVTAFSMSVQPVINKFSSGLAGIMNDIGDFLNKHQTLTKVITALGVGIGVVAVGITSVSFTTQVAIPAVTAFATAVNTSLGPIGWIALGITSIVTAGSALIAMFSAASDETANMTAITRQQYYELQDLNMEYERAYKKYGECDERTLELRYRVDSLSEAFENNRQNVEEFTTEVDEMCNSIWKLSDDFNNALTQINSQESGTLSLIQQYEELVMQTDKAGIHEEELTTITKKLADNYPDLTAQFNNATMSVEDYVNAMEIACEQQAKQLRQQQTQETFTQALQKQVALEKEIAKAQANLNAEFEAHGMHYNEYSQQWENSWYTADSFLAKWTTDIDKYQAVLDELNAAQRENETILAEIRREWEEKAQAIENAITLNNDYATAAASIYENAKTSIDELCVAYDEAYQTAFESFNGQFGLFDEAQANMETTVANAQMALDSQLVYWDNYLSNIAVLKNISAEDLGITQKNYEALMVYAQDGSEQAAGFAASMVEAINSGNIQAVTTLANTMGEISAKQQEIAELTADWKTDFITQMDAIEKEMQETISEMNLSNEAATAASETISSYAEQIMAGKNGAVEAARSVANAVSAALSSAKATVNVGVTNSVPVHMNGTTYAENAFIAGEVGPELIIRTVDAFANGTMNSPNAFIAGDNGPELVIGAQGSTVFPTEETNRLISALNDRQQPLQVFDITSSDEKNTSEQVKRILLEISGSGAIDVGGNSKTDTSSILEIMYEHLKPVLMNIIQREIYEEGDLSYEY